MFDAFSWIPRKLTRPFRLLGLLLWAPGLAGCASAAQDVRDYYRQMAFNYKQAEEKAKVDELSLEGQSKVLAATGDFAKYRRTQRELERIKAWEERCARQEERFQKAAEWTEKRFQLKDPAGAPKAGAPAAEENTLRAE